jgi:aminopeptidase N
MDEVEDRMQRASQGARGIRGKQLSSIGDQAVNALNLYREVWGQDYKFAKLDLVADPMGSFYGQAPASIIYLGFGVFRGEGAVAGGGLFDGGASIAKFIKDVVAHETGHQWWGSLIGNANNRNYWFIESLTEYSTALFVENVRGRKAYDEKVADWRRGLMKFELLSSVEDSSALWGGENPGAAYQYNVYSKGPYAFHVLRQTFGDEKFFKFLKDLAAEFAEKQIVTGDIQQVAERNFGGTMAWFFDQWFRVAGLPQYALFYSVRQTEDGKWLVEGKIKQRVLAGKSETELPGVYFRALAPLTFVTADGKEFKSAKPLLVEAAETPFRLKIAQKPVAVYFNKDGEILAHDVLVNQSW